MSWDVIVQDLPAGITRLADIDPGFRPQPLCDVRTAAARVAVLWPAFALDARGRGVIGGDGFSIEVGIGPDDPIRSCALHVRGTGDAAPDAVADLVEALGFPAIDAEAGEVFDRAEARRSWASWQAYRDHVVGGADRPSRWRNRKR